MTNPEPNPIWSDPTAVRPADAPGVPDDAAWRAPAPEPWPAPAPSDAPAPFPEPAPFAPAPFVSPDADRATDFSPGAALVAYPGTPEGGYAQAGYGQPGYGPGYAPGYGQPVYPVTAVASPTYAGYGAAPTYPPAYPQPGYPGYAPYPMFGPPPVKTNGMATAAMVTSIVGAALLLCYGFGGIIGAVGAILGHVARRQLKTSKESGSGMALAGVIVGWIAFGLAVAFWVVLVIFVIWAANQPVNSGNSFEYGN